MTPASAGSSVSHRLRYSRWSIAVMLGVLVLAVSYLLAVWTPGGQALENAALRGADQVRGEDSVAASEALSNITIYSLAVATLLIGLIGLLRRRPDLAFAGVAVILLGQVITQTLKRFVLPRPSLVEVTGDYTQNSFPSGHTTIAMTVLFAALIVVPYRWRGITMAFVLTWAVGIGAQTVTAKWHRMSDTLGADAVAMICACLASWWLVKRGHIAAYDGPPRRGRVVLFVGLSGFTVLLFCLGGLLWGIPALRGVDFSIPDEPRDYTAYLGANMFAAAFSSATALAFWSLWHRLEVGRRSAAGDYPDLSERRLSRFR